MKLLHVINSMDPSYGGTCQAIRNLVPGLQNLGVESEVVSTDDPKAGFLGKDPFRISAVGPSRGPWSYSSKFTPWLIENVGRFNSIIIHGLWQYPGYATSKVIRNFKNGADGKVLRPNVFVMPHGMLDPYFQKAAGRKLKAIRNILYWKLIEGKVINKADAILFTCEEERQLAKQPFHPYHPIKEYVVGLGVEEPPPFTETMRSAFMEKCKIVAQRPYILFLGRVHEKKGVDLLLRAYIEVFKNFKNGGTDLPILIVAGPGLDSPYGQTMQKLAGESALKDTILFPGMLSGDSKWGALYGCDAFILPSHQENFGIAVVEALACGKPVLISNQVNIWREIEDSGGGIVADDSLPGVQQLLTQWRALSDSAQLSLAVNARHTFEKKFTTESASRRMMNVISNDLRY